MPPRQRSRKQQTGSSTLDLDYTYRVHSDKSFAVVEFELKPDQIIVSNGGSMNYMREGVDRGELSDSGEGGFWSGIGRMFSGQSAFLVQYRGLDKPNRFVTFSSTIPGSVMHLTLQPGQEIMINRGSFIACSPNVNISGKLNWRGFLGIGQQEGGVLPKLTCTGDQAGHVWLGAFGHFQKHELKKNQSLLVDNGLFLASIASENKDDPIYTLENLGKNIVSTAFGNEGIGMKFIGPRVVYTQSHDLSNFAFEISQLLPKK